MGPWSDTATETPDVERELAVPQFRLRTIVFMFAWPIVWFSFLIYAVGPMLLRSDDTLPTWAANLIWLLGNGVELVVAVVILRREGYRLRSPELRDRIRWHWPKGWRRWGIAVVVFAVAYGAVTLLMPTQDPIVDAAPPPEWLPDHPDREFDSLQDGYPDVELEGNYLFFVYRFIILGFILNMIGEELYYRAALLPKMRAVFGKGDWVANGIGFAVKHLYYWWRVPFLVPAGLGIAFFFGPMRSLPLAILAHWLSGEIILFFLGIAELLGVA